MKKHTIAILFLAGASLFAIPSCTKSSSAGTSSSDTTYNGSYFFLSYSGKSVNIRGLSVANPYYATSLSTFLGTGYYQIVDVNSANIGGLY